MSREEIQNKIDELSKKQFYNNMVDHWSNENYRIDSECSSEIQKLAKMLQEAE